MDDCCEAKTAEIERLKAYMLGDSLVYGFSLYALWRSAEWKAVEAILKGAIMAVFGTGVLIEAAYKMLADVVPSALLAQ